MNNFPLLKCQHVEPKAIMEIPTHASNASLKLKDYERNEANIIFKNTWITNLSCENMIYIDSEVLHNVKSRICSIVNKKDKVLP
jgi:hypothetical protein